MKKIFTLAAAPSTIYTADLLRYGDWLLSPVAEKNRVFMWIFLLHCIPPM